METYELEEEVYRKLASDTALTEILSDGSKSIYHLQAPTVDPVRYPILVYSPISDVPILTADNIEVAHKVTIRIHVITLASGNNSDYEKFIEVCKLVKKIMTELDFSRLQTTTFINDGKKMLIFDFVKGVQA